LAEDALGQRDAGAGDRPVQPAEGRYREIDGAAHARLVGDVGRGEAGAAAEFRGEALAGVLVEVGDDDVAAGAGERPHARRPEARRPAADQESAAGDLHGDRSSRGGGTTPSVYGERGASAP